MKNRLMIAGLGAMAAGVLAVQAAQNYVRAAGYVEYTNPGAAIESGAVVNLGNRYGVAMGDIASNETAVVRTVGVFDFAVATNNAVAILAPVYWDSSNEQVTDTAADGTYIGVALKAHSVSTTQRRIPVDLNAPLRPTAAYVTALTLQYGTALNADGVTTNSLVVTNIIRTTVSPF